MEEINVRDNLLVYIIDADFVFLGKLEQCVTRLFRTLQNNDLL